MPRNITAEIDAFNEYNLINFNSLVPSKVGDINEVLDTLCVDDDGFRDWVDAEYPGRALLGFVIDQSDFVKPSKRCSSTAVVVSGGDMYYFVKSKRRTLNKTASEFLNTLYAKYLLKDQDSISIPTPYLFAVRSSRSRHEELTIGFSPVLSFKDNYLTQGLQPPVGDDHKQYLPVIPIKRAISEKKTRTDAVTYVKVLLDALREKGVVHNDLRGDHVFYEPSGKLVVIDWEGFDPDPRQDMINKEQRKFMGEILQVVRGTGVDSELKEYSQLVGLY